MFLLDAFKEEITATQSKTPDLLLEEIACEHRVSTEALKRFSSFCIITKRKATMNCISVIRAFLEMHQEILREKTKVSSKNEREFMAYKRRNPDYEKTGSLHWKGVEDPCWLSRYSAEKVPAREYQELVLFLGMDPRAGYKEDLSELSGMYRRAMLSLLQELEEAFALASANIAPMLYKLTLEMDENFDPSVEIPQMGSDRYLKEAFGNLRKIRFRFKNHKEVFKKIVLLIQKEADGCFVTESFPKIRSGIAGMIFMKELAERLSTTRETANSIFLTKRRRRKREIRTNKKHSSICLPLSTLL